MTPSERAALAAAMTSATGVEWRIAGLHGDPHADGVVRVGRVFPGVVRVGGRMVLYGEGQTRPLFTLEQWANIATGGDIPLHTSSVRIDVPGRFTGSGWLPRFVAAAAAEVEAYDARAISAALSARDRRRAATYRRILRADSGAAPSEREQARRHLERLGVDP